MLSLQETFAPRGICFGCGVANPQGLQIRSFVRSPGVEAHWRAQSHHQAFPGMLSGGIVGALLDCHCNWTAAYHLMLHQGKTQPDCTVTAEYTIKLLRPIPWEQTLCLRAEVTEIAGRRANISGQLWIDEVVYATCQGVFVCVKEGHPAFHRW